MFPIHAHNGVGQSRCSDVEKTNVKTLIIFLIGFSSDQQQANDTVNLCVRKGQLSVM